MKYLDIEGLKYFYNKIKRILDNKSDSNHNHNDLYFSKNSLELINLLYPVGSVITNSNPSFAPNILYPGTKWIRIKGCVIVGIDENDTDFNKVNKTGGSKSLASHSHSMSHTHTMAHTHSMSHTHSFSATTGSAGSHNHSASTSTSVATKSMSGYADFRDVDLKSSDLILSSSGGVVSHQRVDWADEHWGMTGRAMPSYKRNRLNVNVSHNHSASSSTSIGSAGSHTHSVSGTTGGSSSSKTGAASTSTTSQPNNSSTGTTGSGNSGNLQPYITKYIWERIV